MSLKAFHLVFITASVLLSFGFGAWSLVGYSDNGRTIDLIYGVGSVGIGVGLIVYGRYVLRKLKHISYL
jgi:hypothetical protein